MGGHAVRAPSTLIGSALSGLATVFCAANLGGCENAQREDAPERPTAATAPRATAPRSAPFAEPRLLFLPDAGDRAPPEAPFSRLTPAPQGHSLCPSDMVWVKRSYCIDRYEVALQDTRRGRALSPYYHPDPGILRSTFKTWQARAPSSKTRLGRQLSVPEPPAWELSETFDIRALSERGVVPSGYLNYTKARQACRNAGKRLCTRQEWVTACRGEHDTQFPYGDSYEADRCNVNRPAHPAVLLHGNASIHHLDPRLNLAEDRGKALLRRTGDTSSCGSAWGSDKVYDMVGNLDEWIEDPQGMFVGGFFSRATKEGCEAAISSHPPEYYDYSLGARCCLTPH